MKKETKQWKPGQLVTIRNCVYRVTKNTGQGTCTECAFINLLAYTYPCWKCIVENTISRDCHLKKI